MSLSPRRLPTIGFALALFAFLLPFLSISCAGAHVTMTGLQLATGSVPSELQSMGITRQEWNSQNKGGFSGDSYTVLALLATIGGLVITLASGPWVRKATLTLATAAALLLSATRMSILTDSLKEGQGLVTVQFELGFWLAFLAYGFTFTAAVISTWDLPMWRRESPPEGSPLPAEPGV